MTELILWMDKEINKMRRDMDRLFRESWPEIGVGLFKENVSQHIPLETFMTEKAFIIRAVLPGVDPESLDISIKDLQLTIRGSKKEDSVDESGYCEQMTRKLRSFSRTVPLPFKPVSEEIKATLNRDVLKIQVPKPGLREADYVAADEKKKTVDGRHVEKAIHSRKFRSGLVEEHLQDMIDRGTIMIDLEGEAVGQVNGLAVYAMGDYMFGKPSRITCSTAMGRAGIINIEREADLSGSSHNKGVLILGGYLRKKFAQEKPLTMSASIAFEQSYGGVDGDSASSTEIYALLSSLSGVPIKQYIGVTGSVNQNGQVQAIGGVNEKIEGFFDCCLKKGAINSQGVMIPESNVKDLMLRQDVVEAVGKGRFHIYPVKSIDQGIEILTGKKAGKRKTDGSYPKGSINKRVDDKLRELAEGLKNFAGDKGEKEKEAKKGCKQC